MTVYELLGIAQAAQGPAAARIAAAAGGRIVVAPAGDLLGLAHSFTPLGPSARDVDFARQYAAFQAAVQCVGSQVAFAPAAPGAVFPDVRALIRALVANADDVRPVVARVSTWREFGIEIACPSDVLVARAIDDSAFDDARAARSAGNRDGFAAAVRDGIVRVRTGWAAEARRRLGGVAAAFAPAPPRGPDVVLVGAAAVAAEDVEMFDLALQEIDALAPDALDIRVTGPTAPISFAQIAFESAEPQRVRAACTALGVSPDAEAEAVETAARERPGLEPGVRILAARAARARTSLLAAGEFRSEEPLWLAQVRGALGVWGRAA